MSQKKKKPTLAQKRRNEGTGTRKGDKPRQVHYVDEHSSKRDIELARNDLVGFFDDVLQKHHGGW